MSAKVKKWLNRGGLILVAAGMVAITVGGGDTAAAIDVAGQVAGVAGAVVILIRELLN